jgi:hypothetical protein
MEPGMTWAVKDSLVAYVEGLDDGSVEAVIPASRTRQGFAFPWDGPAAAGDAACPVGVLRFRGAVRLTGHWGMLDVELRDPRIDLDGQRGTLLVRERGGRDPEKSLPFADLRVSRRGTAENGAPYVELSAFLTGQGSLLLGGQYPAGQALSPVRITFPSRDA